MPTLQRPSWLPSTAETEEITLCCPVCDLLLQPVPTVWLLQKVSLYAFIRVTDEHDEWRQAEGTPLWHPKPESFHSSRAKPVATVAHERWRGVVAKSTGEGGGETGVRPPLCFLAVWPWASHLISLGLNLLIHNIGKITLAPSSQD